MTCLLISIYPYQTYDERMPEVVPVKNSKKNIRPKQCSYLSEYRTTESFRQTSKIDFLKNAGHGATSAMNPNTVTLIPVSLRAHANSVALIPGI